MFFEKSKKVLCIIISLKNSLLSNHPMNIMLIRFIILMTTITVFMTENSINCMSAYIDYDCNNGLFEKLQIDNKNQNLLEINGMLEYPGVSCTNAGITITALLSITDDNYTYLSFKVEGYNLEEENDPSFENINVTIENCSSLTWRGAFYNGLITDSNGYLKYADNTIIEDNHIIDGHYVRADGSLEYHLVLANSLEKESFIGKKINVEFENIKALKKTGYVSTFKGEWNLSWRLKGENAAKIFHIDEPLGDTGSVVNDIAISPISCYISYECPRTEITQEYYLEDGSTELHTNYKSAPYASGLKLKDGTLIKVLYGGLGTSGYVDDISNTYIIRYVFNRVIDIDDVEKILFVKGNLDDFETTTENDYYCVPLKPEKLIKH